MTRPAAWPVVRRLCVVLVAMAAAGCTMQTNGMGSSVTLHTPGSVPAHPAITPGAIAAASGPPPSGAFAGTGHLNAYFGSGCRSEITVNRFVVDGDRVRYLGFRGRIEGGTFLRMQSGDAYIYGIFDGDRFTGHLWRPTPQCTYDLVLSHVG